MQMSRSPTKIFRAVCSFVGTLGTDGSGVMSGTIGLDPSASATWAQFAVTYDQFRVIGGQIKLASKLPPSSTALNGVVRFAFDNDSATTPTSIADIAAYSEIQDIPAVWTNGAIRTVNFKRPVVKGVVQGQQLWYNETSPSATPGSVKFYGSGLSASTSYLTYICEYLVEFMGRSS